MAAFVLIRMSHNPLLPSTATSRHYPERCRIVTSSAHATRASEPVRNRPASRVVLNTRAEALSNGDRGDSADGSCLVGGNCPVLHTLAMAGHRRGSGADGRFDALCRDAICDQYRHRGTARPRPAVGAASFRLPGRLSGAPDHRGRRGADRRNWPRSRPADLTAALRRRSDVFDSVHEPQGGAFGERSALLHLPPDRLGERPSAGCAAPRRPFGMLAADPSLRGAMQALTTGVGAVQAGRLPADGLVRPMNALSDMLDDDVRRPLRQLLVAGADGGGQDGRPPAGPPRQLIAIDPKLDFNAVQPGRAATEAIGEAARDSAARRALRREAAADRPGADQRRAIRDPEQPAPCSQLARHGRGGAGDPVAGAALGADHPARCSSAWSSGSR